MKANVYRLLPNRARIKRQEAAEVSAMIASTSLPRHLKERVRHELYRAVEPDNERSPFGIYVMLSVQQIGAIWDALRALLRRIDRRRCATPSTFASSTSARTQAR